MYFQESWVMKMGKDDDETEKKNLFEVENSSIAESWRGLKTKDSYEEWKKTHMQQFFEDDSKCTNELVLEDDDKDALLRIFQTGPYAPVDRSGAKELFMYMKMKYGITVSCVLELYNLAFKKEIRTFFGELLTMELDPQYISKFEHFVVMSHMWREKPFKFVNTKANILHLVMSLKEEAGSAMSKLIEAKYDHSYAQEALKKFTEHSLMEETLNDSDEESRIKRRLAKAENKLKNTKGKFDTFNVRVKQYLLFFKELMPTYAEHKGLLLIEEEVNRKLAEYEQELGAPIDRTKSVGIWDTREYQDRMAAYKIIEGKLRLLEPECPVNHVEVLIQQTSNTTHGLHHFLSASLDEKILSKSNAKRKELYELYGSPAEAVDKKIPDYHEKSLEFGDNYLKYRKTILETVETVKRQYPNYKEKKIAVDAIVEAETAIFYMDEQMKDYLANKKEHKKNSIIEPDVEDFDKQMKNTDQDEKIEGSDPAEPVAGSSS